MAKIEGIKGLAEWYELKNYLSAETFVTKDWYRHLAPRMYLLTLLQILKEHPELSQEVNEVFARDIQNMRGGIVENTYIPNFFGHLGFEKYLADKKCGVRSLTFKQLTKLGMKADLYENPRKWFASNKKTSENLHTNTNKDPSDVLTRCFTGTNPRFAYVQIDMDRPDTLLVDSFEAVIPEIRAHLCYDPQKKKYHRPKIQNWARYGLLPYLDLLIWELETGINIPAEVMAFAIKTGYVASNRQLTDTVIPLAKRLMNGGLEELLGIIAIEAYTPPTTIRKK